uniref:DNA topoisomerase n=1 Tax=Strongyloides venezuelensis TaxID=75913 RepID=A0A0K0EUP9_STRVS
MNKLINGTAKVLFVAEKNEAAKSIAKVLSQGNYSRREGLSKFNKIYEFEGNVLGRKSIISTTSVSGHMLTMDFEPKYKKWGYVVASQLFEAPVKKYVIDGLKDVESSLKNYSSKNGTLVIWTDCDREGENIGGEIANTCSKFNKDIDIYRARFSEITPHAIKDALENLTKLDQNVINAVDCRTELDLRIGAAFTRLQTIYLKKRFPVMLRYSNANKNNNFISYGSCQFPTLGFVVDRYVAVKNFIPERFWKLRSFHMKDNIKTEFTWERGRLFSQTDVESYLTTCKDNLSSAKIVSVTKNPKSKKRPAPMDTICLEKLAIRVLKMSAKKVMDLAEKLYSKGYISYPRTETTIYPEKLDLSTFINKQVANPFWGHFADEIMNNGGPKPKNGKKSDKAHPPIYPLVHVKKDELQDDEMFSVYELIVRHFLACCSRDAKGQETTITMTVGEEIFKASGLNIEDKGYLEVYPYDNWASKMIQKYIEGEEISGNLEIDIHEGTTTPPALLNESDLIGLMDKYGIGTDATHAEHIETIQKRKYCSLDKDRRFVPSAIGFALVESYNLLGYQLSKPNLRADLEKDLLLICKGEKTKEDVLTHQLDNYKRIFENVEGQIEVFGDYFENEVKNNSNLWEKNNKGISQNPLQDPDLKLSESVKCHCNKPSAIYTVKKSGPSNGKLFYACATSLSHDKRCNFFQWCEQN